MICHRPGFIKGDMRFSVLSLLMTFAILSCAPVEQVPSGLPPIENDRLPENTHTVLFLHGWNGLVRDFREYYRQSSLRLPPHCEFYIVPGMDRFMGSLDENLDGVIEEIESFLAAQNIPYRNLHLVAHSMGGLAARRFVTLHPDAVRQVFMLGTPSGGVRVLHGVNLKGWCTPSGIASFNRKNPPSPRVKWHVLAGDHYRSPLAGAWWEGTPNDGIIATERVLHFRSLCGDSISCETEVKDLTHPDWNWGANLLRSPKAVHWVLDRILEDLNETGACASVDSARTSGQEKENP